MVRPKKPRCCRGWTGDSVFKPRSVPLCELELIPLELGELEALRLCDLEGLDQRAAGERLGVSRGTVQRMLKRGRARVVRALVENAALVIRKGDSDEDLCTDA